MSSSNSAVELTVAFFSPFFDLMVGFWNTDVLSSLASFGLAEGFVSCFAFASK